MCSARATKATLIVGDLRLGDDAMLERVENEFGDCHFQSPFDAAGLPLTKGSLWLARQSTMHSHSLFDVG
jgi:hypothetical protein